MRKVFKLLIREVRHQNSGTKNIARLNLDVGDLEKSIEFYKTAVKCQRIRPNL